MKTKNKALLSTLIALASWSASAQTYSGPALNGLTYIGNPGDAQFVSGTPDYAQLYTPDAGTELLADDPSVFALGSFGNLGNFTASYNLLSSSVPGGTSPYWIVWVSPPGDSDPGDEIAVIQFSAGSTFSDSSTIHVYDPSSIVGTYFGDTLGTLDGISLGSYTFADMTVDFAGVGIGDWAGSDGVSAYADIESLTIGSVPDSVSTLFLSGLGTAALLLFGRRQDRVQTTR